MSFLKKFITGIAAFIMFSMFGAIFVYQLSFMDTKPNLSQEQPKPQTEEQPKKEELRPVQTNEAVSYSLQNNELNLTFDGGQTWVMVPVEKEQLFVGEYNGSQQELILNSYILTGNRAVFVHTNGGDWETEGVMVTYSLDKGKTWQNSIVTQSYPGVRYRKVDFLTDNFGYIIVSGSRTMSQEGSSVFLTHDGGKTWRKTADSGQTRLLYDGGFTDEKTGFLSYGTINPVEPDLHVTRDGGISWQKAEVRVPAKYKEIFVSAEVPIKTAKGLAMLVNQGPNGDYLGGKVKGKFTSKDNGLTWDFVVKVRPNE
ncbi:WD40/YVTN/BNR-like repeat-containing protein [Bacillus sp. EB01]|uniref:WD40/YVTN/BNR-like repeat-containing protein n=1 Tax=Bacillus sp. EB01 TaxID=1347086 RepID=UPI003FA44FE4